MSKINFAALLLLALCLLAVSCRGSSQNPDNGGPALGLPVDQALNDNAGRLPPSPLPLETGVEGQLTLSGVNTDSAAGPGGGGGNATSAISYGTILARLIDPEDDILKTTPLDSSGRFRLSVTQTLTSAKVQLSIPVLEDINGDGQPGDVITQLVPVKLKAGSLAQLRLSLSSGAADGQPVFTPPGAPGTEFNDFLLISELSLLDAGGQKDEYYGTFYEGNFVVYDRDGDNVFETGEDLVAEDSDSDGYLDGGDDQFFPPEAAGLVSLEGTIVSIKAPEQQIVLRATVADSAAPALDTTISVPPFIGIEVYSERLGFLGPLSFDQLRPGDQIYIEGAGDPAGNELFAQWIVVFRP